MAGLGPQRGARRFGDRPGRGGATSDRWGGHYSCPVGAANPQSKVLTPPRREDPPHGAGPPSGPAGMPLPRGGRRARTRGGGLLPREWVIEAAVLLALATFVAATAWLAASAAAGTYTVDTSGAPVPGWVSGPLRGIASPLTPDGFSVAMIVMLVTFLGVLAAARFVAPAYAVGAIVAAHVAIALAPPLLSADVFGYIAFGRIGTVDGLNPYLSSISAAPHDPILPYIFWRHARTPYGPLFTLGTYSLAWLGPKGMLWALKALAAAASLGVVALVWRGAAQRGRSPVAAALLVGLNPVTIVYAVGGAHNDLDMTLLMTAAILVLGADRGWGAVSGPLQRAACPAPATYRRPRRRDTGGWATMFSGRRRGGRHGAPHPVWAGAIAVLAIAVKLPAALLVPYLLVGTRRRRGAVLGIAAAVVAVAAVTVLAFGAHPAKMLSAAFDHRPAQLSGPYWLARLLSTPEDSALRTGCAVAAGVLAALTLLVAWWRRRHADAWIACAGWAFLGVILAVASFQPWYVVWVLPLAALANGRSLRLAAIALTMAVIAIHLPVLGFVPAL